MSTGDSLLNLLIYTYFNFVNSVQFDIKNKQIKEQIPYILSVQICMIIGLYHFS